MSERGDFDRILDSLNGAMLDDARWPSVSALIDVALGAKGGNLIFAPADGSAEIFFSKCYFRGTDRSEWRREYFRDYYDGDEHIPRLRALPDGKIAHIRDLFSERELRTSRMYNEFLARCDGRDSLSVRFREPSGSQIVWWIADAVDAGGWSSSRIEMIAHVAPHLRQYVRVRSALADAGALSTSATELLDNTRVGIIQLDRSGRIVEANDRASDLLRRSDGLSDRNGTLSAATPEDGARLQELLAQALPRFGQQGTSGSMTVRRPSLLPRFAVHVKPVASREDYRSRHVAALLLIVDPVDRARSDPGLVASALGLTPAESQIAVLLAEGRTLPQIAAATGRGYGTVRSHLKHIFAKLGVTRQVELARLVLALSNLPAPASHPDASP